MTHWLTPHNFRERSDRGKYPRTHSNDQDSRRDGRYRICYETLTSSRNTAHQSVNFSPGSVPSEGKAVPAQAGLHLNKLRGNDMLTSMTFSGTKARLNPLQRVQFPRDRKGVETARRQTT